MEAEDTRPVLGCGGDREAAVLEWLCVDLHRNDEGRLGEESMQSTLPFEDRLCPGKWLRL